VELPRIPGRKSDLKCFSSSLTSLILRYYKIKIPEVDRRKGRGLFYLIPAPSPCEQFGHGFGKECDDDRKRDEKEQKSQKNTCCNVKAPSAKIRRKRLGSLKATKNMSDQTDAPSAEAMSTSRPSPVTRERRIPKLLVKIDRRRMVLFS